ncbi:MAG: Fic family protein, partial [Gammaproteobacteria bacterium]
GRSWLQGREDRPEWSHVWRALLTLIPDDASLQAQGRSWLQDREDRPEWAFVWQALLKIPLNDVDLRELLERGAKWCRNREDRVEYPYVEGELKTRAARYWRELPETERGALLRELIIQWTHDSTAIEGNTLSLGETRDVIEHGLTIRGKPLKDHQEVIGHKRAADLVFDWSGRDALGLEDLFALHRAVFTEVISDIMQPIGRWKVEPNFIDRAKTREGRTVNIELGEPSQVPVLMEFWLNGLNRWLGGVPNDVDLVLRAFVELHVSFVRVHPFFDGNGRMARLLSNLPLLKAGYPPLIVPERRREEYKLLHTEYDLAVGRVDSPEHLAPEHELLQEITGFCRDVWRPTLAMVAGRVFRYWMR